MATMNFSVPGDVKAAFDKAFTGKNKSAVLSDLMHQAIEEQRRRQRRSRAIARLLRLRKRVRPVSDRSLQVARIKARP